MKGALRVLSKRFKCIRFARVNHWSSVDTLQLDRYQERCIVGVVTL